MECERRAVKESSGVWGLRHQHGGRGGGGRAGGGASSLTHPSLGFGTEIWVEAGGI